MATDPLPHRASAAGAYALGRRALDAARRGRRRLRGGRRRRGARRRDRPRRPGGRVVLVGIPDGDRTSFTGVDCAAQGPDPAALPPDEADRPAARDPARRGRRDRAGGACQRPVRAAREWREAFADLVERRGLKVVVEPQRTGRGRERARYALGVDFGTESGRAVLVDCRRRPRARHRRLPLPARRDRRAAARRPTTTSCSSPTGRSRIPRTTSARSRRRCPRCSPRRASIRPTSIGIGIDFTACTMLPTLADGTPLCLLDDLGASPHAWVKLWKHHAAQPEADRINEVAAERGEPWLAALRRQDLVRVVLREGAPDPRRGAGRLRARRPADRGGRLGRLAAHRRRDAQQLHGRLQGDLVEARRLPVATPTSPRSTRASRTSSTRRCRGRSSPLGSRAGGLSEQAAAWTGLRPGTPVAVANVDAHVSAPAATVTEPGTMVADHGHEHLPHPARRRSPRSSRACAASSRTASCRACSASRRASRPSATSSPGSRTTPCRPSTTSGARQGIDVHAVLEAGGRELRPGESGLLALDWWNGNRSVLVDADLCGLLVGITLATKAPEIYRALIEATAFGTRVIIDAFEPAGVRGRRDRRVRRPAGAEPAADADLRRRHRPRVRRRRLDADAGARLGDVRGGRGRRGARRLRLDRRRVARGWRSCGDERYVPIPAQPAVYEELYAEYVRLHDLFGRGEDPAMKRLRAVQRGGRSPRRGLANLGTSGS